MQNLTEGSKRLEENRRPQSRERRSEINPASEIFSLEGTGMAANCVCRLSRGEGRRRQSWCAGTSQRSVCGCLRGPSGLREEDKLVQGLGDRLRLFI